MDTYWYNIYEISLHGFGFYLLCFIRSQKALIKFRPRIAAVAWHPTKPHCPSPRTGLPHAPHSKLRVSPATASRVRLNTYDLFLCCRPLTSVKRDTGAESEVAVDSLSSEAAGHSEVNFVIQLVVK